MVRKASRKTGNKPGAANKPSAATPTSGSNSSRTNATASGGNNNNGGGNQSGSGQCRGSRTGELQNATQRLSLLYQAYDPTAGNNIMSPNAPQPSHAAVVAAAAVIANRSGQTPPPTSSIISPIDVNARTARRLSLASASSAPSPPAAARTRRGSRGTSPTASSARAELNNTNTNHDNDHNQNDVHSVLPNNSNCGTTGTTSTAAAPSPPAASPPKTDSPGAAPPSTRHNSNHIRRHIVSSDDAVLPRPNAKIGSYANENPRLTVSEPLRTTNNSDSAGAAMRPTSPNGAAARGRRTSKKCDGAQRTRRKFSSRSLSHNTSQMNVDSTTSSDSRSDSKGRPRALSLPRLRENVGEVLPRLQPVRVTNSNGSSTEHDKSMKDTMGRNGDQSHPPGSPSDLRRPSPPVNSSASSSFLNAAGNGGLGNHAGRSTEAEAEVGELREVLSAPPASFSGIVQDISPLLALRRNRDRSIGGAGERQREFAEFPSELEALSEGGGSDAAAITRRQSNNAFLRSMKAKAPPLPPFAAAEKESAKKLEVVDDNDDSIWGDPERSQEDMTRHMFSSTQLLSTLRPTKQQNSHSHNNSSTPAAVGSPVPPASRPQSSPPASTDSATAFSPCYKFSVVLSSGKTATAPISLAAGSGCVQGMRPTMEDAHFIEINATHVRGQPVSLMAVLDGHCGRCVADLGAKWLPHYILHHPALGENNALALVESILQTDREIFHIFQAKKNELEQQHRTGRNTGRRRRDTYEEMFDETTGANGGSTLIVAAVCGRMLYVACLGDARAVLYDGQTTIAMSEDHKPGNAEESRRIGKCGGFVQFGRVCGILAVSRALGDFEFKFQSSSNPEEGLTTDFPFGVQREGENANSTSTSTTAPPQPSTATASPPSSQTNRRFISNRDLMVSNVADVRQLNLTDASAFLLLACDGLWDVLSNEEATEFVRDFLCYTPDVCDPRILSGEKPRPTPEVVRRVLNSCCQKLTEFAVDRGSMDNVSAMVLFFHDVVDTVARFNGRQTTSREGSRGGTFLAASARGSRGRQSHDAVQTTSSPSSPPNFELTNNQLKVRNGRVFTRR